MNCPFCSTPMDPGNLTVSGAEYGVRLFDLSYQECWFEPEEGPAELLVSSRIGEEAARPSCGPSRDAHRCPMCDTVVAPGDDGRIERAVHEATTEDADATRR